MIINSDFKDFYDQCVAYGLDKGVVFNRVRESCQTRRCRKGRSALDDKALAISDVARQLSDSIVPISASHLVIVFVGFCGKIYTGLAGRVRNGKLVARGERGYSLIGEYKVFWKPSDFSSEQLNAEMGRGVGAYSYHFPMSRGEGRVKTINEWFERMGDKLVIERPDMFFQNQLCTFFIEEGEVTLNPALKNLGFQRVVDGVTAFQEVAMHVASLNSAAIKQPEPITDRMRAATKGFDDKSFRKGPTK